MINVDVVKGCYKISMDGHAGYDGKGRDIVCASATMLYHTLVHALYKLNGDVQAEAEDGHLFCRYYPDDIYDELNADSIFATILIGLQLLAESYPDYIKFV